MTSIYGDGGAGGKITRQSNRKHKSTPYARPPTQFSKSRPNPTDTPTPAGWLSRIVDPARRLISTGATRFLPSVFSNSPSPAIPLPDPDESSDGDANCDYQDQETDLGSFRLPEEAGCIRSDNPSNIGTRNENMDCNEKESGLSEIEQLMRGKSFSRDEANRLTEILHLKAARNSDDEEMRNISKNRQSDPCIVLSTNELPISLTEEKRENSSYATWEHMTVTPLRRPTLLEEVGASPVDIARAYMGSISTGAGTPFRSATQYKKPADQKDGLTSLSMLQPYSSKPSICWPGARVQEHRGFMTPQNPRSKYGLYSSQRSPYSRTINSKSKLKHQLTPSVDRDRPMSLHVSESPYRRTVTPCPTQDMDMDDASNDGYGSLGPIRSKRHIKVSHTPYKESTILAPSSSQKTYADRGTLPVFKSGDTGSSKNTPQFQRTLNNFGNHVSGIQSPHPHSSQMARRILDHIDRKVPTLREKTEEIRIASFGQKASTVKLTTPLPEKDNSPLSNGSTSQTSGLDSQKLLSPNLFGMAPNSAQTQFGDAQSSGSQKLNVLQWNLSAANEGGKSYTSSVSNQVNGQSGPTTSVSDVRSVMPAVMKGQQSHSFGNKPNLTSITINKPDPRRGISFGSSSGFTFPVPASSDSEPPTPSITPAKVSQQQEEGLSTPLFTFGSRKTSPNLVFSFTTTNQVDDSDIKFQFGSDTVNRISFSAVAENKIDTK